MSNSTSLSKSQLQKLIERMPGTVFQYRQWPDGRCTFPYSTKTIEEIFFAQPAELALDGSIAWDRLTEDSAKELKEQLKRSAETLEEFETVCQVRSPQNRIHWIRTHSVPESQPDGSTLWFGHIENITEQHEKEEATKQKTALLNLLFETLPDHIYYKDRNARILTANPACYQYHGYDSAEAIIGKTNQELYSVSLGQQIYNKEINLMMSGKPLREREQHVRKDHSVVYFESIKSPLKNNEGETIGLVGISRDITEQVTRENELFVARKAAIEASKAKSSFLAMMSHEIRTPMNGVIGAASLLMGTELSNMQEEFVHTIQVSGDNLLSIINDILDYSKIEAGKIDLESIPFSPRECVEDAFDLFVKMAAQKNLELLCDIDPSVPDFLQGDPSRLRQILINLLGNAIKFTEQGEVGIQVRTLKSDANTNECSIQFSVHDTGIGISPKAQARLFQPFTQADLSSTRKYGGTGLGLAISRRLTELMGGKIRLCSQEGEGSSFTFTANLPLAKAPQKTGNLHQIDLQGKRILIVDDNETNQNILIAQMKQWNAVPVAFAHPKKVIPHLLESAPYDLALLDYQMPEMNGATLAQEISQVPGLPKLPIIILSSSCESIPPHPSIDARMTKPVKITKLKKQMSKLLGEQSQDKSASTQTPPSSLHIKPRNLSILVAEDNPINQRVAQMMLKRLGYDNVAFVKNGLEAVAATLDTCFDIILMDVQMPEMNGLDATREIRKQSQNETKPWIIALTAGVMEDERKDIILSGMNDFLAKPLAIETLEKTLDELTDQ